MNNLLDSPRFEAAADALIATGHPQLARIDVYESDSEVELSGHVASYYLKQVAQESVRVAVAGRKLRNRIVVGY
ncbi:MAG: BON domain-containing protein [Gemmataceae bacterium]